MSNNLMQAELDIAEEYILTTLFGSVENPQINPAIRSYLAIKGEDPVAVINKYIDKFENIVRPLLNESNGYVNGEKLSKLLEVRFNQKTNFTDCRLVDIMRALEPMLNNLSIFIK